MPPATQGDYMTWTPWATFWLISGVIGIISLTLIPAIISLLTAMRASKQSDVNKSNVQSLAAGQAVLAQNQTTSRSVDSPPASIQTTSLQIAADPTKPAPMPGGLTIHVSKEDSGPQ